MQLQAIEQEAQQLDQQLQLIEQSLVEMQNLNSSLEELEKTDKKEILANIGRGIYIPAEIKDKTLTVEVGNKTFVKKSIKDTKVIIEDQIDKLNDVREQISDRIESLRHEVGHLMRNDKCEGNHDKHEGHEKSEKHEKKSGSEKKR